MTKQEVKEALHMDHGFNSYVDNLFSLVETIEDLGFTVEVSVEDEEMYWISVRVCGRWAAAGHISDAVAYLEDMVDGMKLCYDLMREQFDKNKETA